MDILEHYLLKFGQRTAALSALVEVFDTNLCHPNLVHTALADQPPGHTGSQTLACGYPP